MPASTAGRPSSQPGCAGQMVHSGSGPQNQLVRAESSEARSSSLPEGHSGPPHPNPNEQCGDESHINHQGGTRSRSLMAEAEAIRQWVERHLESIQTEHISGVSNVQADWLSRQTLDHSEWGLHPWLFHQLARRVVLPLDLFAMPENAQLPCFFSRFQLPCAEGVDALRCPWPLGLLYAFPRCH